LAYLNFLAANNPFPRSTADPDRQIFLIKIIVMPEDPKSYLVPKGSFSQQADNYRNQRLLRETYNTFN